jgi:hypothetical protein
MTLPAALHLEAKRKAGSLSMSFSEYMRSLIRKDLEGGQQWGAYFWSDIGEDPGSDPAVAAEIDRTLSLLPRHISWENRRFYLTN